MWYLLEAGLFIVLKSTSLIHSAPGTKISTVGPMGLLHLWLHPPPSCQALVSCCVQVCISLYVSTSTSWRETQLCRGTIRDELLHRGAGGSPLWWYVMGTKDCTMTGTHHSEIYIAEAAVKHFKLGVALGIFSFYHFIDCKTQKCHMSWKEALSAAVVATNSVVVLCCPTASCLPGVPACRCAGAALRESRGDFRKELYWRILGASPSHCTVQCHLQKLTGLFIEAGCVTTSCALART